MSSIYIAWIASIACIFLGIFIAAKLVLRSTPTETVHTLGSRTPLSKHQYKALSSGTSQIRLLVLEPGVGPNPIIATVKYVFLDESPNYEALSYTWGDASITTPISVDGYEFRITINLEIALRHLRLETKSRILWIDAICINQSNTLEKSQQVSRMRDIYSKAQRVLVWLGPEGNDSNVAMDAIGKDSLQLYETPQSPERSERLMEILVPIVQLLERPWWSRCWVIQEVLTRKNVLVICGRRSIPWATIYTLFYRLEIVITIMEEHMKVVTPIGVLEMMARLRYLCMDIGVGGDLLRHLYHLRQFSASEPKDKVWVAGIILGHGCLPDPDYSLSLVATYGGIVCGHLEANGNLDILEHCHGQGEMDFEFPSWVPDWRVQSLRLSLTETGRPRGRKFAAGGETKAVYAISKSVLHLMGFNFDQIHCFHSFLPASDHSRLEMALTPPTRIGETYRTGEATRDVLKRVERADIQTRNFFDCLYQPEDRMKFSMEMLQGTETVATGRKLMTSEKNYLGLVPDDAKEGDRICIFPGGHTPFVLRPFDGVYRIVGSCYIDGIMDGEAIGCLRREDASCEWFVIM